jgi:hypothetical protein
MAQVWARRAVVVAIASLVAINVLAPTFGHVSASADHFRFAEDARIYIPSFYRDHDGLCRTDYTLQYIRTGVALGFAAIYESGADPELISKRIPYVLDVLLAVFLAMAAYRLGGPRAAVVAVALLFASPKFLSQLSGGIPRSFAFPIYALTMWGTVAGRPIIIAVAALAGALFYPPAAIVAGGALAVLLLVIPRSHRGLAEEWTLARRVTTVAVTAVVCILLTLPIVVRMKTYGARIGPANRSAFPEARIGGRYVGQNAPPYVPFANAAADPARPSVVDRRTQPARGVYLRAIATLVTIIAVCGFLFTARESKRARRLLTLAALAPCLYVAAVLFDPVLFIPNRYLAHLHIVLVLAIASGATALASSMKRSWQTVSLFTGALLIVAMADLAAPAQGLNVDVSRYRPLMESLASDPTARLIAGWPNGPVDSVPYIVRKPAFVAKETHQAFHTEPVLEMRRRMNALIDAYWAESLPPLLRLRNEFGVTHLIVNRSHYRDEAPTYFEPFRERILDRRAHCRAPLTMRVNDAVTFREGDLFVIDLQRLERLTRLPAPLPPAPVSYAAVFPAGHRRSSTPPASQAASGAVRVSGRR